MMDAETVADVRGGSVAICLTNSDLESAIDHVVELVIKCDAEPAFKQTLHAHLNGLLAVQLARASVSAFKVFRASA